MLLLLMHLYMMHLYLYLFPSGMESFPTVHDLAAASEDEVNAHWAGLGFYRRARFLHKGAQHVVTHLNGEMPQTVPELLEITGIGPYTANAVASIAFDVCVPVVDGNVCRVLSRLTGIANHIKSPILKDKLGWDLAKQLVEAGDGTHAGEVNQALMELGATYCAPSGTGVDPRDPLIDFYRSTQLGRAYYYDAVAAAAAGNKNNGETVSVTVPKKASACCQLCDSTGVQTALEQFQAIVIIRNDGNDDNMSPEEAAKCGHAIFPLAPPKLKKREEDLAIAAIANTIHKETWWLLVKRPPKGLLAGQWEFPSVCVQTRSKTVTKPPRVQPRRKALTSYLQELHDEDHWLVPSLDRTAIDPAPLEHIFSHVKHIMWIEACTTSVELETLEWKTSEDREVRWMREVDMKQVGITSGVKKILKAAKTHTGMTTKSAPSTKKRKR
jgi:A/G-specific adenine glycosylase